MLTPEQRLKLKSAGYSDVKINAFEAQKSIKETQSAKEPGYLDRIKGDFQTRREEVKNINTGSASLPEKILQNAGQVAGGATDLVAELPGIKQGLDVVGKGVGQVVKIPGIKQGVELGIETYDKLPENVQKDLGAIVNIASLLPVGMGAKGGIKAGEVALDAAKSSAKAVKTGAKAVGKVSGEIIPTADRVVNFQVSKALDLTQGDIKNINLSTGNEVGEFLARKNLIRGNKAETTTALKDFFDTNYKTVRDEIGKVKTTYKQEAVPRYKQALQEIQKQVGETTGLETATKEIKDLLKKKQVTLNDVQRAKELLDEHFSLYKVTGAVKEGVAKSGLTNLRKDLKQFIEKEVKNNTGADIGALNNEVSTAKSTLDAIEARSTRGLTASNLKLGDMATFGVGSMLGGGPLTGLAALAAKKILGTSAVRLKFAKWLDGISDARKVMLREKLLRGEVPEEVSKLLNQFSESKNQKTAKSALAKKPSISTNTTAKGLKVKGKAVSPVKSDPLLTEARKYKSAEEFVKAQFSKKPEYGMGHRPSWDGTPPAHDLLEGDMLPRDVYTHPDFSIASGAIGRGEKAANESWAALQKIKGKPDAVVTIYRAGAKDELNTGDWVTFSKEYAKDSVEGTEKVHSFKVKARDVLFAGDDINEFGYYPKSQLTDIWKKANKK